MTLEILDNNGLMTIKIQRALNKLISEQQPLNHKLNILAIKLRDFIYEKLLTSETYASLAGGILRAEFGLDNYEVSNLPYIISELTSVDIDYTKTGSKVGLIVNMCNKDIDFNNLGVYISESKRGSFTIHWLYWLMTQGIEIVVPEFSIWLKPGAGRSEMAFMFRPEDGGSYSVDEQFSGTEKDNWVTRTLRNNKTEIANIINKTMNNTGK